MVNFSLKKSKNNFISITEQADDDSYVVVENLRHMLQEQDPLESIWFGLRYNTYISPMGYMQGGAGYVLSRGALDVFVEQVTKVQQASLVQW